MQPHLVAGDLRETVRERRAARAQRFHLGPSQNQSRLVGVLNAVVVVRTAITGDDLLPLLPSHVPPVAMPAALRYAGSGAVSGTTSHHTIRPPRPSRTG